MPCANGIFLYCLSSVGSLGQLISLFLFGNWKPACFSSAAIFGTITHAPAMDFRQKTTLQFVYRNDFDLSQNDLYRNNFVSKRP